MLLHSRRDIVLLLKNLIERERRHLCAHDIEHVRGQLLLVIGELIVGISGAIRNSAILHGDRHLHEDVVFGLGLNGDGELLNA